MKTQRIVAAIAAASLVLSGGAFAQTSGAQDLIDAASGRQPQQGPVKTPQQLREDARTIEQNYRDDLRQQYRTGQRDYRADQRDNRGYDNRGYDNRGYDNRRYDNRGYDNRGYDNRRYDYRNYYREGGYRGHGRGAGPSHSFYRGDRLPYAYRSRHYVVDDWRGHHLYAPPQGYHWVQAGGDYVLAAIATGVIAAIRLSQ
jgi:Ni/Co efflux regulator RcnB